MEEIIKTEEDVNERFPSGYYIYKENEKDILINGIDHTIRELNGKNLTKIPSVIICTKDKNSTRYVSNRDRPVNAFGNIQSHYKKVIDKKDYSYDFSKFYYIEDETILGNIPTKLLLHNKNENYNYGNYTYNNTYKALTKEVFGIISNSEFTLSKVTSVSDPIYDKIDFHITVKKDNNSDNLIFEKNGYHYDYTIIKKVNGKQGQLEVNFNVKFYFEPLLIVENNSFSVESKSLKVSVLHKHDKFKNIGLISQSENCRYGIYKIKENGNYNANKYIALKFDEFAAIPNYIQNFYTRMPGDLNNNVASLQNDPKNIIQSTETITEVYAIKHY